MKRILPVALLLLIGLNSFIYAQDLTDKIVIDQFGYRPISEKIAVIRNPQTGFDKDESFSPGSTYSLVNAETNVTVFTGTPTQWNNGTEDGSSGDKVWWFDFTEYETEGTYYVLDVTKNVKSFDFEISKQIYQTILKHALRTFYYQRSGFAKEEQYAGEAWADGASHIGNLQDTECRSYVTPNDASSELDVSGGWYDAGDLNKYTPWTGNYCFSLLMSYHENPDAFGDDYNIPSSGNDIPDILDETKFGLDHLLRMQFEDGSIPAVVDASHASPPSSATGQSLYGGVNTTSALSVAGAFAFASKIFKEIGNNAYGDTLKARSIKAWDWAVANPSTIWKNNSEADGTKGLASGQQETDDYGRLNLKIRAAVFLLELTGDTKYRDFVDNNYTSVQLMDWTYAYPFQANEQSILLYYANLSNASANVASIIKSTYKTAMDKEYNFQAFDSERDPYLAYMKDYGWGSNSTKSKKGTMFMDIIEYGIDATKDSVAKVAAERYLHYIHGVNPLNLVYLSNMYDYGGDNCVNEFYHTWFTDGSTKWDNAQTSTYGPPPGFLTGGANPSYDWDQCCPSNCGSTNNNAICNSLSIAPPKNQPDQKSYLDFNTNWPLNSWSVTENSCGYQTEYIRLLSKFVTWMEEEDENTTTNTETQFTHSLKAHPNPTSDIVYITGLQQQIVSYVLLDINGKTIKKGQLQGLYQINVANIMDGVYILKINNGKQIQHVKLIKAGK